MLFFPNAGSVHFYLGAQLNFAAVEFDGLIDGFDIREEIFIFRVETLPFTGNAYPQRNYLPP